MTLHNGLCVVRDERLENYTGCGNTLTENDARPQPTNIDFRLGNNANSGAGPDQQLNGAEAKWGKWNRLLTSTERAALQGGEMWPFSKTPSLRDAVAYYKLDEVSNSATYADATGRGNTLTRVGTTTRVTGPLGGADRATDIGNILHASPTADLKTGNSDFTVFGFANFKGAPVRPEQEVIWGQVDLTINATGLVLYLESTGHTFNIDYGNGIDLARNAVIVATSPKPVMGTWYSFLAQFDSAAGDLGLRVDNGPLFTLNNRQVITVTNGKIGNGAKFSTVSPIFVPGKTSDWDGSRAPVLRASAVPNRPDVSFGDNAKTGRMWFKADSLAGVTVPAGIFDSARNHMDWVIGFGENLIYFTMGDNAGHYQSCTVPLTDTTNWHLLVWWYDKSANRIHLNLDHGAQASSTVLSSIKPSVSAVPFMIGANYTTATADGATHQFLGMIDEMGIANGIPGSAELAALWNGGAGWTPK